MAKKTKYKYKRNIIEEIASKIKLVRHNIKYSIEMIKTSGGGEDTFRCSSFQL